MDIGFWRLIFDSGLIVLIWLVQLIIYPSFCMMRSEDLLKWHAKYTSRISLLVVPLMLGQLVIIIYQVWTEVSPIHLVTLVLVLATWLITFLFFLPAHNKITNGEIHMDHLKKMVQINWWRTVLWSLVFILGLLNLYGY